MSNIMNHDVPIIQFLCVVLDNYGYMVVWSYNSYINYLLD